MALKAEDNCFWFSIQLSKNQINNSDKMSQILVLT